MLSKYRNIIKQTRINIPMKMSKHWIIVKPVKKPISKPFYTENYFHGSKLLFFILFLLEKSENHQNFLKSHFSIEMPGNSLVYDNIFGHITKITIKICYCYPDSSWKRRMTGWVTKRWPIDTGQRSTSFGQIAIALHGVWCFKAV